MCGHFSGHKQVQAGEVAQQPLKTKQAGSLRACASRVTQRRYQESMSQHSKCQADASGGT